jgi:5-methylcytosine-specific restriction endonuclease McrA
MRRAFPKRGRRRLEPKDYKALCLEILRRDGWRCQLCGRRKDLQVHHIEFRSRLGSDCEGNLITLCAQCHQMMHSAI